MFSYTYECTTIYIAQFMSKIFFIVYACMSTAGHNKDHLLPPVELLRSLLLCYKPAYPHQTIPISIQYCQPAHLQSVQTVVLILDEDS